MPTVNELLHSIEHSDEAISLTQPLEARKPVGYDISFLEDYQPNKTYYLSEPLRRQLFKMGDTQQTKLPTGTYGRAIG